MPANHKWFRTLAIARALVNTMRDYKDEWEKELVKRGQQELELIRRMREAQKSKQP